MVHFEVDKFHIKAIQLNICSNLSCSLEDKYSVHIETCFNCEAVVIKMRNKYKNEFDFGHFELKPDGLFLCAVF